MRKNLGGPQWYRFAFLCNLLAIGITVGLGLVYGSSQSFYPYHRDAIGTDWALLPSSYQLLFLAFLRGSGGAALAAGLAMGFILFFPFREREPWSRWAILLTGLCGYLPLLWVTTEISQKTQASPPVAAVCGELLLFVLGFWLSADRRRTMR